MAESILDIVNVSKRFGGVKALQDISFSIEKGSVHALCGENGAGKSTMVKILSGEVQKDSGEIFFKQSPIHWHSPREALHGGITIIAQELRPLLDMSIAENLFLGREPVHRGSFLDKKKLIRDSEAALEKFDLNISVHSPMRSLSLAQMQIIEIIKAISRNSEVLIMDEPTSAIGEQETEKLFEIIDNLKSQHKTIIYISHRLKEIYSIADRITVLRDGMHMRSLPASELSTEELISQMIGKKVRSSYFVQPRALTEKKTLLQVKNFTKQKKFRNISFSLHEKEILGIFGLMGSGRSSFLEAFFGISSLDEGRLYLREKELSLQSPAQSIQQHVACVTEDRKASGLILAHSVRNNISLPSLQTAPQKFFLRKAQERSKAESIVKKFRIKISSLLQETHSLSGGNQQKIALGKWILTSPEILLLDEPTRGIDVGAKQEIYSFMNEYTNTGKGIIMISSELPEILAMSHRVLIFKKGEIVAERERENFDSEEFMHLAS